MAKPITAAESVTIVLDLPPRELTPNSRAHWAQKAKKTRSYRRQAWAYTLDRVREKWRDDPRWPRATAQAVFYFPDKRRRDRDNLLASLKAAFDGIADAGLIADDAGLTHLPVQVLVDAESPRVQITVTKEN